MPIYEYQGQQYEMAEEDPIAAKNRILTYLGKQTAPATAPVADEKGRFDAKKQPRTPAVTAEPTLSPEEQVTSQVGAPSTEASKGLTEAQKKQLAEATKKYEEETPFLQRITDPLKAGYYGAKQILPGMRIANFQKEIDAIKEGTAKDALGRPLTPEAAKARLEELQKFQAEDVKAQIEAQGEAGKIKRRPTVEALNNVENAKQAFQMFQIDPLGVMASVSLESTPQLVPALILGAVSRNPRVAAMAMGSTSFAGELSSGITDYFQEHGVNVKDPVAVNNALNDPTLFNKALEHATTRASIIGAADTLSAGMASKMLVPKNLLKSQLAKEAVNVGVAQPASQMISGAGGEAAAQLATEGKISKPGQVLMEAVGEGPTSLLETTAFGGQQAYERLPSTIAKREEEAKAVEKQKKILETLNAPGAVEALGKQFNDTVEKLLASTNPDTNKPYTEDEAYAIAGDAILQEGGLDGLESTIGGADQSSVSVPSGTSPADTGITSTAEGNVAATSTATPAIGGGEGTELNTLAAELKAKYPQLTDEQALKNAEESLRQKQMAAGFETSKEALKDISSPESQEIQSKASNMAHTLFNPNNVREDGRPGWEQPPKERWPLIEAFQMGSRDERSGFSHPEDYTDPKERQAYELGQKYANGLMTGSPVDVTAEAANLIAPAAEEAAAEEKPPVKMGKPRGRPRVEKTAEQKAKDDAYKKQRQAIGKNAINEVAKAEKVLNRVVDEQAIIENSGTEKEAQDTLRDLREERINALSIAHGLSVDPDQKTKTAGKRATALLEKADPQERELGKQRYEAKQKLSTPSRSEIIEATNGQDNAAFEKFDFAKGALNYIARKGNPFEKALAKRLAPFLNGVKFVIVDSEADMPTPRLREFMKDAAGLFDPTTKAIYVLREGGVNNTVVLHEALHAATIARINAFEYLKEKKLPIPAALRVPIQELKDTMEDAKKIYDQLVEADALPHQMLKLPQEAFTDMKEFVAYGLSLPLMQDFLLLAPGEYAGEAPNVINKLFTRFVQSLRKMFNMDKDHMSALQDLMIVTNKILSTPITQEETLISERLAELEEPSQAKAKQPKAPPAPKAPKPPKQLKMVTALLRKIRLSKRSSELNGSIGELIMQVRNASDAIRLLKAVYSSLDVGKLNKILPTLTTEDITRWVGDKINNIKVINTAVNDMAGMRTHMIRELAEKTPAWVNFNKKYEEGGRILGDLMNASTLLEVDPTKFPDLASALKGDTRLQRIEKDLLNPPINPATNQPKSVTSIKAEKTKRVAALKLIYEGGVLDNPITGEKYTMGGWEKLGKFGNGEGHAIYKMAKDSYQQTFNLHEQLLIEKITASNVPGDTKDASTPKGKLIAAITKTFQEAKTLEVYFPLMRFGGYWYSKGKGKSGEFYMFESATARNNAIDARVEELNRAGDKRSRDKMIADGDLDIGDDMRKLREKVVESSSMLKEIFEMLDTNKTADIDAIKDNIYQMYLMTLPEKDIRRKFTHRQGKTGFSADVLRNFITSQHTAANQLARLKYADKIRNGIASAYAEISQNPDKLKLAAFIREISTRALSEITPSIPSEDIDWNQLASVANKFVFYWLLTSPKSAMVQMTQLTIVGLPTLGAEFGVSKTLATAARYSALWNKFGIPVKNPDGNIITKWGQPSIGDSNYVTQHKDPAYRKILTDAWNFANDKDIFMSTYASDMSAMSEGPTARYHGVVSTVTRGVFNFMGGAFHHAERISREIMFMSSFELAFADYKQRGMDDKAAYNAATEKALKLTYDSLFNYTQYNKPRVMKSVGGRIAFQFMTYPLQMTSYLVRNFYGMLPLLNKEQKKEAAIKFFGTLGMTGAFAGITGFPLYSLIMGAAEGIRELMRDDDEDYDEDDDGNPLGKRSLDLWFRSWFIPHYFGPDSNLAGALGMSEEAAHKLQRSVEVGPISALTDLNVGTSTSLDGLWFRSDAPAATSREAFQNFVLGFGGPIVSVGMNIAGAFDDFEKGQLNRGFEKIAPAWLKGGLTSYRLGKEGATTPTGNELMNPEYFTTFKLAAQALGFGSTEVNAVQKANILAKGVVAQIEGDAKKLLDRLDVAVEKEDDDKVEAILDQIEKFNIKNSMMPITGETISKSLQAREERRGKAYQGLSLSDKQRGIVYPMLESTRSPEYK